MRRPRTRAQKDAHAARERKRYATLKAGLVAAITMKLGLTQPRCTMPRLRAGYGTPWEAPWLGPCDRGGPLEIDHRHFTTFHQRRQNSVQRLEHFAAEFIRWMGGDASRELRLACRSCNARHQPKKIRK